MWHIKYAAACYVAAAAVASHSMQYKMGNKLCWKKKGIKDKLSRREQL